MSAVAETAAAAEAHVEAARADLAATLDLLKDNLTPAHLVDEVLARPKDAVSRWIDVYGRFASKSPLAGLIIGAAALALSSAVVRRPKRAKLHDKVARQA